jgi:hypothetical protein
LGAYNAFRRPKPLGVHYLDAPTKVIVVGGGFGGIPAVPSWCGLSMGAGRWGWSCWTG